MTTTVSTEKQARSWSEFLDSYPEDGRYEWIDGELVRILATRHHEDIADFLYDVLKAHVDRHNLDYKVSGRIVIATQTEDGRDRGRHPDVSVVDRAVWDANRSAYAALREPLQLAIEVVSTNWEDDYIDKLDEYQRSGIPEYWIVDYMALGSRNLLGNPKQPTVFVYRLDDRGIYQVTAFQGRDRLVSPTFPDLELTVDRILEI